MTLTNFSRSTPYQALKKNFVSYYPTNPNFLSKIFFFTKSKVKNNLVNAMPTFTLESISPGEAMEIQDLPVALYRFGEEYNTKCTNVLGVCFGT